MMKQLEGVTAANTLEEVKLYFDEEPDEMLLERHVTDDDSLTTKVMIHHSDIYVSHCVSNDELDNDFWDRLYGNEHQGWLATHHILLWCRLLMHARPVDARWVISPIISMVDGENLGSWAKFAAGKNVSPAWWSVDKIWIPIVVDGAHWLMGELDITNWKFTFYDSSLASGFYNDFKDSKRFDHFSDEIVKLLNKVNYRQNAKVQPRADMLEFGQAKDVPQQRSKYGNCGVYVCMFLERLASGLPITCLVDGDPNPISRQLRYRMGNIYWNTKAIKSSSKKLATLIAHVLMYFSILG